MSQDSVKANGWAVSEKCKKKTCVGEKLLNKCRQMEGLWMGDFLPQISAFSEM